eukprot:456665_1
MVDIVFNVNITRHTIYFACANLSIVCSFWVIWSYYRFNAMRRHPAKLLLWRSIFDTAFGISFVILFCLPKGMVVSSCSWLGAIFHFTLMGSQTWYFLMSIDLFCALRNPFADLGAFVKWYHATVFVVSVVSVVVISASDMFGYREGLQVCWIKLQDIDEFSANLYSWVFFFAPTIVYYFSSLIVSIYAFFKFQKGLSETLESRRSILRQEIAYNVSFGVYWSIAGSLYAFIFAQGLDPDEFHVVFVLLAVIIGSLGVVDATVWMANNWDIYRMWWASEDISCRKPDRPINYALRREVLHYTTTGIIRCAKLTQVLPALDKIPPAGRFYTTHLVPPRVSANSRKHCAESHIRLEIPHVRNTDAVRGSVGSLTESSARERLVILKKPVQFIDYCPQVFRALRRLFRISDEDYLRSLGGDRQKMLERYTEGRSEAFFFFTTDSRFIVKTLLKSEVQVLLKLLPSYAVFCEKHPGTFLNRFVGLHSVFMYHTRVFFVVMESVFNTDLEVHERYDLKGSWIDRNTDDRRDLGEKTFRSAVMKDSDLHTRFWLSQSNRKALIQQCFSDSSFLRDHQIMDYSLLIGVHYVRQRRETPWKVPISENLSKSEKDDVLFDDIKIHIGEQKESIEKEDAWGIISKVHPIDLDNRRGINAEVIEGPGVYYFGIIDMLQVWTWRKKLEWLIKVAFLRKDPMGVSCVEPSYYQSRFARNLHEITEEISADELSMEVS